MDISVTNAKKLFSQLLRSVEDGESVATTRYGKPVARLVLPPAERRVVRFGAQRGKIHVKPVWDAPIDLDPFISGDY